VFLEATLEWAGTADDFDVEVAADATFEPVAYSDNTTSSAITLPPGTLEHETTYYWRVTGNNGFGAGAPSTIFSFTTVAPPDTEPPSRPQSLTQTGITSTTVALAWDASSDNVGVTQYRIFRDGAVAGAVAAPTTSFTDTGLAPATAYSYHVTALDAAGNEGPASGVLDVTTDAGPTIHVASIVPELRTTGKWSTARAIVAIVDESGAPVSGATVVAQWSGLASNQDSGTTSSGEVQLDSDKADRRLSGEFVVTVVEVSASGFVYDPSSNAVTQACVDSTGELCPVGPPPPPDTDPPAAPTSLEATPGPGSISLDWPDNTDDPDWASFSVYRSEAAGGPYDLVAGGVTASQYTDTEVTPGTTYYYVVTAEDTSGNESGHSPEASAAPDAPPELSVHVAGITVEIVRQGKNYFARATVSVADQDGQPVAGVEVTGDWTWNGVSIGSSGGTTDGGGAATLASSKEKAVSGDVFTFTATGLVLGGYAYDPGSNVKSSESAPVP
jgi:chitodextrinase